MKLRVLSLLSILMVMVMGLSLWASTAQAGGGTIIYLPLVMGGQAVETPGPAPTGQSVFGVVAETGSDATDFQKIDAAGADWVQPGLTVNWSAVEPVKGKRNWAALAALETQILAANQYSQTVIVTIDGTPGWALVNPASGYCGPITDELPALRNFLHDLVARYSLPPYNVRVWELWNLPDTLQCWGENDSVSGYGGAFYGLMLQSAYPAIKQVDPEATVLVGALEMRCNLEGMASCNQTRFIQSVMLSASDSLDGIAFYAFDGLGIIDKPWGTMFEYGNSLWNSSWNTTGPVLLAKANYLTKLFPPGETKKLVAHLAMQCMCGGEFPEFEAAKANYVIQAYSAARARGLNTALWQSLKGPYMTGLVKETGELQPAYRAWKFARQRLAKADYIGPASGFPGVRGYSFLTDAGRQLDVIWYISSSQYQYSLLLPPANITNVWDMYGNPAEVISSTVKIDADHPIYIEYTP